MFIIHSGFVRKLQKWSLSSLARPSSAAVNFLLPSSFGAEMIQTAVDGSRLLTLKRFKLFPAELVPGEKQNVVQFS